MVKKKISTAALKRLKEKGVKLNVVKKAERPAENINAAPTVVKQNSQNLMAKKPEEIRVRSWEVEVDTRDFQGFVKTLTIIEF